MQYQDLFEMIADVRKAVAAGDRVVNYDNPLSRHLGYQGLTQEWTISLYDVKHSMGRRDGRTPEQQEVVVKFPTARGRLELVYSKP